MNETIGIMIIVVWSIGLGVFGTITAQLLRRPDGLSAPLWFNTIWNVGPAKVVTDVKIVQVGPFPNPHLGYPHYFKNRQSQSRWRDEKNMQHLAAPVTFRLYVNGKMIDSFLTEERALEKAKQVAFFAECKRETRTSA